MKNKMESDLQRKVRKALLDDSRTREYEIEVLDENGVITLQGHVPSREISRSAEKIVENLSGVASVINELQIETRERKDAIKARVDSA